MTWRCEELTRALQALMDGTLGEADKLRAQAHLDGCAGCRRRLADWEALTPMFHALATPRPHDADRIWRRVQTALATDVPRAEARERMNTRRGLLLAAVAAAALSWFAGQSRRPAPPAPPVARVLASGDYQVSGHDYWLTWGELTLDVTGANASVCTPDTCARVFGTRFTARRDADGDHVSVEHGVVSVAAERLPETYVSLTAGEAMTPPWTKPKPVIKAATQPEAAQAAPPRVTAAQLAARADEALLAGRPRDAEKLWDRVLADFPRSPEADSAAYQLARGAYVDGRLAEAKQRFEQYLRLHPSGVFVKEAREALAR